MTDSRRRKKRFSHTNIYIYIVLVDVLCATLSTSVGEAEKRARDKGRIRREGKNVGVSLFSLPFPHCELWRKRKTFSLIIINKNYVTNRLRRGEKNVSITDHRWQLESFFSISTFLFLSACLLFSALIDVSTLFNRRTVFLCVSSFFLFLPIRRLTEGQSCVREYNAKW